MLRFVLLHLFADKSFLVLIEFESRFNLERRMGGGSNARGASNSNNAGAANDRWRRSERGWSPRVGYYWGYYGLTVVLYDDGLRYYNGGILVADMVFGMLL